MMTARTKGTITATLILLYGFGIAWWWTYLPPDAVRPPEIAREYKAYRAGGH